MGLAGPPLGLPRSLFVPPCTPHLIAVNVLYASVFAAVQSCMHNLGNGSNEPRVEGQRVKGHHVDGGIGSRGIGPRGNASREGLVTRWLGLVMERAGERSCGRLCGLVCGRTAGPADEPAGSNSCAATGGAIPADVPRGFVAPRLRGLLRSDSTP